MAAVLLLSSLHLSTAAAARPNFIFVLADDWVPFPPTPAPPPSCADAAGALRQGYGDTSVYNTLLHQGVDIPATPRLQQMGAEGTVFTNFHTLGAECSPSRASWMTGRSPSDKLVKIHLVIGNHATNVGKGCGDYVPTSTPTVTSTLHQAGYFTAHFGDGAPCASSPEASPLSWNACCAQASGTSETARPGTTLTA